MTNDPKTGRASPAEPERQATTRGWIHHHALFVAAVLSGYRIRIYQDRKVHPGEIGEGIESWDKEDETWAIEEGRRQLDAQLTQLQYVTSRASVLLPVGVAASIYFLTALEGLGDLAQPRQAIARILLLAGSALTIWGALVMGALIGGRATFSQTDALLLTKESGGLRKHLARDYAENVSTGVNTNAARLTHLGTGVTWIAIGALLGVVGLALSVWSDPPAPCHDTPTSPVPCVDSNDATSEGDPPDIGSRAQIP